MASLDLNDFFADLGIVEATMRSNKNASIDEGGDGGISRASFGTRLWEGSVTIQPLNHVDADVIAAKISYLEEADVTFRVGPAWSLADTATTDTLGANSNTDRRIVSLPQNVEPGGYFGVIFSTDKRSMHQVVERSSGFHTVIPPLPFGVGQGDTVVFNRVEIDAVLIASDRGAYQSVFNRGLSFDWRQFY